MKKLIFPLLFFISSFVSAQTPNFVDIIKNDSIDNAYSMFQASNGDYVLLSSTNSDGQGGQDIQITKTDGLGGITWSYTYGTSGDDVGYKIKPTTDGGAVIAGYSDGFGSTGFDALVFKINSSGTTQWARAIKTDSAEKAFDVIQTQNGNIYVTGYMNLDSLGDNIFVMRISNSGSVSWVKTYGGAGDDRGIALEEDRNNQIAIVGSTENDSVTIGETGDRDIKFLLINAGGTVVESKNFGTSAKEEATSVLTTNDYKYIIGGNINGGPGSGQDVFILELDSSISVNYANWFGTTGTDNAYDLVNKFNGELLLGISVEGTTSAKNAVVMELSSTGNSILSNVYGGFSSDANARVALSENSSFGHTILTSGKSFGIINSEDLYLIKPNSFSLSGCVDQMEMLMEGSITLSSANFTNTYNTGSTSNVTLTRSSITNSDTSLCCNLEPRVASDSFTICETDLINLGQVAISGYKYSWSSNSSTWTSAAANPSVSPTSNTLYKLVVSSDNPSCDSDSAYVYVKVNARQIVSSIADTFFCKNESVDISAASGMNFYSWTTRDFTYTTQEISITTSDTVFLYMLDNNSCVYRDTVEIKEIELPVFSLGDDTTICDNLSLTLGGPAGMSDYKWNGTSSSNSTYTTNTSQTHTLEVTNLYGCKYYDEIQVLTNPSSSFSLGNDTAFCEGSSVDVFAPTALDDYKWNDTASTLNTLTVTSGGTYWLEAYNSFDCPAFDTIVIQEFGAPKYSLGNDTGFCDGRNMILNGPNSMKTYVWFNGSGQQSFTATGTGSYYLEVIDDNDCSFTDTIEITEYPNPDISLGNDTTILIGTSLNITPGSGFTKYVWSTNETTESIAVNQAGKYSVTVTDINGCEGTDEIEITVSASVQYTNGNKYSAYPNPAVNTITIETTSNMIGTNLQITDLQGKVVYSKIVESNKQQIDVSDFINGLYNVILNSSNKTITFKVQVEH